MNKKGKRKPIIFTVATLLFVFSNLFAGQSGKIVTLKTKTGILEGTLLIPETKIMVPVALIIAGSGPTDRDGNNPMMRNDSLKMLANALLKNEIATLRYDKRGISKSRKAGLKESNLRFENYIKDAEGWIKFLKDNKGFSQIIVVGHSEGSLIGMIASQQKDVDKFISIAGIGQPADRTIREQLKAQSPFILKQANPILNKLVQGKTVKKISPVFYSLFRPSIQPYMISWFKYDPQKEIEKLKKPVLIIQGTTDIQVSMKDAKKLKNGNKKAKLVIIKGMNHILKESKLDRVENIQTYNQPKLPIKMELIKAISDFIN